MNMQHNFFLWKLGWLRVKPKETDLSLHRRFTSLVKSGASSIQPDLCFRGSATSNFNIVPFRSKWTSTSCPFFQSASTGNNSGQTSSDGETPFLNFPKPGTNSKSIANSWPSWQTLLLASHVENRHTSKGHVLSKQIGVSSFVKQTAIQFLMFVRLKMKKIPTFYRVIPFDFGHSSELSYSQGLARIMVHTNLFRLTGTINCRISKLVIDLGSYAKVISQDAHILGLDFTPHLSPYMLPLINNGTYIKVSKQVFLSFCIGNYKDWTTCDVISMDACHLLLGLPLQFDRDVVHQGKTNTYSFFFGDRTITLL